MYRRTRYLDLSWQRQAFRHLHQQPAILLAARQRLQRLAQARAVNALARRRQKLRTVGVADDQLAIGGQETVLAILQAHVQMRATVAIDPHLIVMTQGKHAVASLRQRIEPARPALLQFVQPTQWLRNSAHDQRGPQPSFGGGPPGAHFLSR